MARSRNYLWRESTAAFGITREIAPRLAADFLLVDIDVPEISPSWDLVWELVRLGNRDQIVAVVVAGRLRQDGRLGRPRPDA